MLRPSSILGAASSERGAVLLITMVFMLGALVLAAYAIEAGVWFVHGAHLQTEADAAALSAGESFQYPCEQKVEENVAAAVHRYDGTTVASGGYNEQVPVTPRASQSGLYTPAHELFSLVNRPSFVNQSLPNDAELAQSPSPCSANMIAVKLSETNSPSFFPFGSPKYLNAQARVSIEQESSTGGLEPFVQPLTTPNSMTATLVDEKTKEVIAGPETLTSTGQHTTWEKRGVPVTFNDKNTEATIPIGLRVAMSGETSATCEESTCYERESGGAGVAFIRAWSNSGTPGQPASGTPVAPQAEEVTVEQTPMGTGTPCTPATGQPFSNFISTATNCTVQVSASHVRFAEGSGAPEARCRGGQGNGKEKDAGLFLNGVELECPTTSESEALNGKSWTSKPVTVTPNSGLDTLTLTWRLTKGKKPSGATAGGTECTKQAPCEGTLAVQRVNSGAYNSQSEATSKSGPIIVATVTEAEGAGAGKDITSIKRGETRSVNITVQVRGFQDSTSIESPPVRLSFGGNQEDGAIECPATNAGAKHLEELIAEGCPTVYETTSEPYPQACEVHPAPEPPVCAKENPGEKLNNRLEQGMDDRINEGSSAKCVNPNHWVSPNKVSEVVSANDPRLINVIITDYGVLRNGTGEVPVRAFASFYVTGWFGDPCTRKQLEKEAPKNPGELKYTYDEEPEVPGKKQEGEGVLLGHFVKYVKDSPYAKGSGECHETTFGDCVAVLTK
jgi:hypothetical protein